VKFIEKTMFLGAEAKTIKHS